MYYQKTGCCERQTLSGAFSARISRLLCTSDEKSERLDLLNKIQKVMKSPR